MSGQRVLGFLFIIFCSFFIDCDPLANSTFVKSTPGLWKQRDKDDAAYHVGYALGVGGITIMLAVISGFLWKYGIRWSKKNEQSI
jgi:NADH:ubiquinone oxidoreductase subunit 4 (subunit M)